MGIVPDAPLQALADDPDDYRPASKWRLIADPTEGGVGDIAIVVEQVAPGDAIPLHIHHDVNECVLVISGKNEFRLGDDRLELGPGDACFIPKGTAHAQRNVGDEVLVINAFFPSTIVDMELLERNPAPGTETDAPKHTVYDMRSGRFWER